MENSKATEGNGDQVQEKSNSIITWNGPGVNWNRSLTKHNTGQRRIPLPESRNNAVRLLDNCLLATGVVCQFTSSCAQWPAGAANQGAREVISSSRNPDEPDRFYTLSGPTH